MKLFSITLHVISMPLKVPFMTHLGSVKEREGIIVEIKDIDGVTGYGEGVAFSTPWYTEETVKTSIHVLSDFLIPLLKLHPVSHPNEAADIFAAVRGNRMAKAALETALWDLYSKRKSLSLSKLLGGTQEKIPAGVVIATDSISIALEQIEHFLNDGYQRIKMKIHPGYDASVLKSIRKHYPDLPIMADANSAYTLKDVERLKALDEYGLMMIEQPLGHDDIIEHSFLQKQLKTPICLDESITSFDEARKAVELGSCQIINIKIGRVGGLSEAKKIHDYCVERKIKVWCGGMIEFGVSRAHNIALASLPGFTIPGDISASSRFWEEDIILPEVLVDKGFVKVPDAPGIGFDINAKRLEQVTIEKISYRY